jgi:hypothetical protein
VLRWSPAQLTLAAITPVSRWGPAALAAGERPALEGYVQHSQPAVLADLDAELIR